MTLAHSPYMLGVETSCDESAVALVDARGVVKVNAVASQIELHARFGGVVPEEASRRHIEALLPMIHETLGNHGVAWDDIHGVAVTRAPGLIGCLLVGVETAKALAWRHEKPLYGVNHLHGHLYAPYLTPENWAGSKVRHTLVMDGQTTAALPEAAGAGDGAAGDEAGGDQAGERSGGAADPVFLQPAFPHVGLIVSGGHTSLAEVRAPGRAATLATTRDDAVGEAYDKVARILGLGFPGGPEIDRRAAQGSPARFPFTVPMNRRDEKDFSFSGLKTAMARKIEALKAESETGALDEATVNDLCASFQAAAIEALLNKSVAAARERGVRDLVIVGGVASNRGLRAAAARVRAPGLRVWFPHGSYCTDNAAMIAGLAWNLKPLSQAEALDLNANAVAPIDEG